MDEVGIKVRSLYMAKVEKREVYKTEKGFDS